MANQGGTEPNRPDIKLPDPVELSRAMAKIAERSRRIVTDFVTRQVGDSHIGMADPLNIGSAFLEMTARLMANPAKLVGAHVSLWRDYMTLWQNTTRRWLGDETAPVAAAPGPDDRRFKDAAWDENQLFDFIKQSYLLSARWIQNTVRDVDGLDEKTAKKIEFYTRQFVDAMAPSNFVMTNPEVIRATVESSGDNLVKGLSNLLEDLERGKGKLSIKMTDLDAFKLGENIAVTPGKVIYQNDLLQLLQYEPTTEQVQRRPLLIIPPWINKYYILDLRDKNSFIKWAVGEGHTVFVVSWVNPDEGLAAKTFEDYMLEGPLAALNAIKLATGEDEVNVIGYCLGGTLLAATLSYMAVKGDERIRSATFLTTMVDFAEAGELGVFIDEAQLSSLEDAMREKGYLEGSAMATTFNMLRANDLMVLRGQQLSPRQGPLPLRPALLELGRDPHAGGHAQLLPAQDVPGEPAGGAGRDRARRRPDRPQQDHGPRLSPLDPRGSHRAVEVDLRGDPALSRPGQVLPLGLGSHRRGGQPAGRQEVLLLDGR